MNQVYIGDIWLVSFNFQIDEFVILTGPNQHATFYPPLHPAGVESVTFSSFGSSPPRPYVYGFICSSLVDTSRTSYGLNVLMGHKGLQNGQACDNNTLGLVDRIVYFPYCTKFKPSGRKILLNIT